MDDLSDMCISFEGVTKKPIWLQYIGKHHKCVSMYYPSSLLLRFRVCCITCYLARAMHAGCLRIIEILIEANYHGKMSVYSKSE